MIANPLIDVISHIMWQPTSNCLANCRACYVSESTMKSDALNTEIVDAVYRSKKYVCYQFTVSLDILRHASLPLIEEMKFVWKETLREDSPELCVTAHDWNTVLWWAREMKMTNDSFLRPITLLSLSSFPSLGKICDEVRTICGQHNVKLNFNYMVKGNEKDSKPFEMGVRYADQVYLVLQKPTLGGELPTSNLQNWFIARGIVKKQAPSKLIEDQCIKDSVSFINSEECCGAGNKKMHVWPNGQATGCPYDAKALVKSGQHPMECCKISEAIRVLNEALKNKPKAIEKEVA